MVYDKEFRGNFVYFKSINEEDAEFSFNIRNAENNRSTVGQLAESVEAQREFIRRQRQKPGDYYFVVYNNNDEKIGLIGVYDIVGDAGEVGREVNDGSPVEAMEAEILLEDFAIDILGLKRKIAVIYTNNRKHIKSQQKLGYEPVGTVTRGGTECLLFETAFDKEHTKKIRQLINQLASKKGGNQL
ncbi:MAG: GNAT family N-acetyltransferase [Eubacterium sp.]|nr:GNAT family N-acetyltransferase [Eubacterium sp.]